MTVNGVLVKSGTIKIDLGERTIEGKVLMRDDESTVEQFFDSMLFEFQNLEKEIKGKRNWFYVRKEKDFGFSD